MAPDALLARILEVVPRPVWVVNHLDRIVFANQAACRVLGYGDASELRGKRGHETVHYKRGDGTPYPQHECPMLRPRQTGQTVHSEDECFVHRDGSMIPIAWWSAPIDLPGGLGAVLTFSDISERLAAQKVLRERDAAEVRAAESQAAQRRILESATAARQQLARDLHDGAQQRIVTMLLRMQMAREQLSGEHLAFLDSAIEQASAALVELRELAAGIHPPLLTTRGLYAAVKALARRSTLPVGVSVATLDRFTEAIEANAYFLIAEALTNAVKHSHAARVEVSMNCDGRTLTLEIRDDGIGGVSMADAGFGLKGMTDRASGLGGHLTLVSPEGGGTSVCAVIPVDAAQSSSPVG